MREEHISEVVVTQSLALNWDRTGAVIGISGKYIGMIFRINPNQKIYIGRDYRLVDFVLTDNDVSRQHCWIEYDAIQDRYFFCDVSKNGVIINGKRMREKDKIMLLSAGDEIQIANTKNIFKLG